MIEIFTDSQHPVHGVQHVTTQEVAYYELDKPDQLLNTLNATVQQLPRQDAMQAARNFYAQHHNAWSQAYQGLRLAYDYELTHFPAIVFHQGQAVIYGETHLTKALKTYQQWQRTINR